MNTRVLIVKVLTIAYRENLLDQGDRHHHELIKNTVNHIDTPDAAMGKNAERDLINGLKDLVLTIVNNTSSSSYTSEDVMREIRVLSGSDDDFIDIIEDMLNEELSTDQINLSILREAESIEKYYKELQISDIIGRASYDIRLNRTAIPNLNDYVTELISELDTHQGSSVGQDPAIVDTVDFDERGPIAELLEKGKEIDEGVSVLKTGWKGLNRAISGGIRRGEFIITPALQHKNKTGISNSLFRQIPTYNIPQLNDKTKKPLIVKFGFEDALMNDLKFLYTAIVYNETRKVVDISKVSSSYMEGFIIDKLKVNGWHIKMSRINPSEWTYRNIIGKLLQYEAEGYEVIMLLLDYLAMVPTTGCINTGAMGTDLRDMFRRIRNFCTSKMIACITPHQLNPSTKDLLTGGVLDRNLLREIDGRGFTAGSRQLDQEVDLEIYLHLFEHSDGITYQNFQRGKHRGVTPIASSHKNFYLPFPPDGMPILDDILLEEENTLYKLPIRTQDNAVF